MVELAEYILRVFAAIVIVVGLVCAALVLLLSEVGVFVLFIVAFVAVTAAGSGTALLAVDSLYPRAVDVPGLLSLLRVVLLASLASVLLFDITLEGLLLRALRRLEIGMTGIGLVETIIGGFVTAVSLIIVARFMPAAELSVVAALAAGMTGAFVRYYVGLYLLDIDLGEDDMDLDEELD